MKEDMRIFTSEDLEAARKYRKVSGIMTAIAVGLYIVCWLPLVICGVAAESVGANVDFWSIIGLCIMMLIVAVATAILIVNSYMKPVCLKDNRIVTVGSSCDDANGGEDKKGRDEDRSPVRAAISSAVWMIAVASFLCLGFLRDLWHPGWIVFIFAVALDRVVDVVFAIIRKKRSENKDQ